MDHELQTQLENAAQLQDAVDRLTAAAAVFEQAAQRIEAASATHTGLAAAAESQSTRLDHVVATVENDLAARLTALEQQFAQRLAELEARAAAAPAETTSGRRTVAATASTLLSKHGMTADGISAGALDAALVHLSLEQRIAVKAELMRAGLLG